MNHANGYLPPTDTTSDFRLDCPDIIREYCKLSSQENLSEADADRLSQILEIAESDEWIDFWLNEADHFLAHELNLTNRESIYNFENQQAKLREHLEHRLAEIGGSGLVEGLRQQLKISSRELQQHLKNRGFDPGPIDGVLGPRTHSAIVAFQQAHQLPPNGVPDVFTREALGLS
jgi:hypothetical protein